MFGYTVENHSEGQNRVGQKQFFLAFATVYGDFGFTVVFHRLLSWLLFINVMQGNRAF